MSPKVKNGLSTGAVGALLNLCVGAIPCCGQIVALGAGGIAGYLTGRGEPFATKGEGAKSGAISGAISGALVLVGQLIGAIAFQLLGPVILRAMGQSSSALDFGGGIGLTVVISCCLGLVGVGFAAGAGALAGYMATQPQQAQA